MRATGLIRRIDDLGRVVIPKELRIRANITENDPMEIFIQGDYICFKKYHTTFGEELHNVLSRIMESDIDCNSELTADDRFAINDAIQKINQIVKKFEELKI